MNVLLTADPKPYAPDPGWTVPGVLSNLTGLMAALLTLVLLIVALRTVWSKHQSGDVSGTANTLGVVLLGLVIAALGAGGVGLLYGASILSALGRLVG